MDTGGADRRPFVRHQQMQSQVLALIRQRRSGPLFILHALKLVLRHHHVDQFDRTGCGVELHAPCIFFVEGLCPRRAEYDGVLPHHATEFVQSYS